MLKNNRHIHDLARRVAVATTVILLSACASGPPREDGPFREPDLVELVSVDPTIHLDIRYATANNFIGQPVYRHAAAFLQRPAAEALVRVSASLREMGYGLVVYDSYRPWSVTKLFWDLTPPEKRDFVADPKNGSRHNRGCAVDLSLYDLTTGEPITMPSDYDDFSERANPDYEGGAEDQRHHRDLLREVMESEGFTVYKYEWWHFDFRGWREYSIQDVPFDEL